MPKLQKKAMEFFEALSQELVLDVPRNFRRRSDWLVPDWLFWTKMAASNSHRIHGTGIFTLYLTWILWELRFSNFRGNRDQGHQIAPSRKGQGGLPGMVELVVVQIYAWDRFR